VLLTIAGTAVLGTSAAAAPRRIAVVNAARDQEAGASLANRLRTILALEPMVTPIPPGDLARALESALASDDGLASAELAVAADQLARARESLAQFDYQGALAYLADAEQRLLAAWPSPESTRLLADTVFERGHIYIRQKQRDRALRSLVLAHRLDPARQLDPERYMPEVIEAFTEAVAQDKSLAPSVTLEVTGLLDGAAVYLDGRFVGHTPLTTQIAPDNHYVSGTFAGRAVGGQRVIADPARGHAAVKLRLGKVTIDERARHWRKGFVDRVPEPLAPDLTAEIGRGATDFTGADAALVIASGPDGQLHLASYDAREREAGTWSVATEPAIELALAPFTDVPAPPLSLRDSGIFGQQRDSRPWYTRPTYRGLVNSGIAVSMAAVVFYVVLQGSHTVSGSCCTLGSVGRSHSFGFSF
jgi:hypothetical protein